MGGEYLLSLFRSCPLPLKKEILSIIFFHFRSRKPCSAQAARAYNHLLLPMTVTIRQSIGQRIHESREEIDRLRIGIVRLRQRLRLLDDSRHVLLELFLRGGQCHGELRW